MEEGDHHQSGRQRVSETRNDAIDGSSSDPAASGHSTNPAGGFISAGMWHGLGIAERDRDYQLMMTARHRLANVAVTDPDMGMPPGYMKNSVGARILAKMGYKVGMGIGKEPGIRMPLQCPPPLRAGTRRVQEPTPASAPANLANP